MNPKVIHRALQCEQNTRKGKHESIQHQLTSRTLKIALELFIESQSHLLQILLLSYLIHVCYYNTQSYLHVAARIYEYSIL